MRRTSLTVAVLLAAAAMLTVAGPVLAQSNTPATTTPAAPAAGAALTAVAELKTAQGEKVGEAKLRETPGGVLVEVSLTKVPAGAHAFHIHDAGKCEGPGFTTAGGHFNPGGRKHGLLSPAGAHAGDLPNVHVPASGALAFEFLAAGVSLKPESADSLLDANGAALVLHAKADDYTTDPAGAAGDRIACGVIQKSK